jgi:adenine-specific DNA-methyltransferase
VGIEISYMGTKRKLARAVSAIVQDLPCGPLLDVFSGMCSVGRAVAPSRQIWTNDMQAFPALVAKTLFCSRDELLSEEDAKHVLQKPFRRNYIALEKRFRTYLRRENKYLRTKSHEDVLAGNVDIPHSATCNALERERKDLSKKCDTFPYRLASISYMGSFFGVRQCMEIDSIRYAIDLATTKGMISLEQKSWLIVALGKALSLMSNSTGHFAQHIKPKKQNIERIIEKRKRDLWEEYFTVYASALPLHSKTWRLRNRSYQGDSLSLLQRLRGMKRKPAVIYADPPYSSAQYSRYYHVLDVLVDYAYPQIASAGRYPNDRFQTPFSHVRGVGDAMNRLLEYSSQTNAALVLSYPGDGIYCKTSGDVKNLLRKHYKHVTTEYRECQEHSTFGSPCTSPKKDAVEYVYLARN